MVALAQPLCQQKKEALLIMFGNGWRKRFWALDGENGRPNLADCVDFAVRKLNKKAQEDLVDYVENHLKNMSKRCEHSARNG